MFCRFPFVTLVCRVLGTAVILGIAGACSPEHYRAEADKEVYQIIAGKWHDSFGSRAVPRKNPIPENLPLNRREHASN